MIRQKGQKEEGARKTQGKAYLCNPPHVNKYFSSADKPVGTAYVWSFLGTEGNSYMYKYI